MLLLKRGNKFFTKSLIGEFKMKKILIIINLIFIIICGYIIMISIINKNNKNKVIYHTEKGFYKSDAGEIILSIDILERTIQESRIHTFSIIDKINIYKTLLCAMQTFQSANRINKESFYNLCKEAEMSYKNDINNYYRILLYKADFLSGYEGDSTATINLYKTIFYNAPNKEIQDISAVHLVWSLPDNEVDTFIKYLEDKYADIIKKNLELKRIIDLRKQKIKKD